MKSRGLAPRPSLATAAFQGLRVAASHLNDAMGTPVTPSDIEARAFLTTPGRQAAGFAEHTVPVLTPVTFVLSFFTLGLDPGKIRQETYEIFGLL
jgi:hypothetical protein